MQPQPDDPQKGQRSKPQVSTEDLAAAEVEDWHDIDDFLLQDTVDLTGGN